MLVVAATLVAALKLAAPAEGAVAVEGGGDGVEAEAIDAVRLGKEADLGKEEA